MRNASPALLALLNSGDNFEQADLWEITLNGGQVIRWTNADIDLKFGSDTYISGPLVSRTGISDRVGFETSQLEVTIVADSDDQINGVPVISFISRRGLDGARVVLKRAFMPSWSSPVTGTIVRFAGRVTSVGDISGMKATLSVSSWMILFNVNYPPDLYQVPCLNSLYNEKCGLDKTDWEVSGEVVAGTLSVLQFPTDLELDAGWLSQGTINFTSGANSGITRSVRTSAGDGVIRLVQPLPTAPMPGDTFTALPGCDLRLSTCKNKFDNLLRFRGYPFVPTPETAI